MIRLTNDNLITLLPMRFLALIFSPPLLEQCLLDHSRKCLGKLCSRGAIHHFVGALGAGEERGCCVALFDARGGFVG